jgi:hypothetical protein
MRQLVENTFAVLAVLATEAWFLKGYYAGQPEFEPAIALLLAVGALLAKDPIRTHLAEQKPQHQHDQELFAEFLKLVPYDPAIRVVSEHDFEGPFKRDDLKPIFDFAWLWESVQKEFVDKALEQARHTLHQAAIQLRQEIAGRTVPVRMEGYSSVYSDEMRSSGQPRPTEVAEDARVLNELAGQFAKQYADFVRICRSKLSR